MRKEINIINDCTLFSEDDIVDAVISSRGIRDYDNFIYPMEDSLLPYESMKNIDEARETVVSGIEYEKSFLVWADTDLDGITSGTEIYRYLKNFTDKVAITINEGKAHGLIGQNLSICDEYDIIIIVDSLDEDVSQYRKLKEKGKDIIILDHHEVSSDINYGEYATLVSSSVEYGNESLSGAGVTWKFCKYIDEYFTTEYADELVDLAACGIVGDMSDMSESSMENRYICRLGLNNLKSIALKKIVGSYEFNSTSVSFSIAPLVNACNRTNNNMIALNCFISDDKKEVSKLVKRMQECREEQNLEVDRLMDSIREQLDSQKDSKVLYAKVDTDYGIRGLIGNKILEEYQKPLLILTRMENEKGVYYSGSGRGIGVEDFRNICENTGLGLFRGHPNAFGVVRIDDLEDLIAALNEELKDVSFKETVDVDVLIEPEQITSSLVKRIKDIDKICGEGFKRITFMINGVNEYSVSSFKQGKHLVLKNIQGNSKLNIIQWNTKYTIDEFEDHSLLNDSVDVIGVLEDGFLARQYMLKLIANNIQVA